MEKEEVMSEYKRIVEKLFIKKPEVKGKDKVLKVADYFGNPQNSFKVVHVTGTNGKGSVSVKTAVLLEKSGRKTGLFVSPHLSTVRERIQVDRKKITEEEFLTYYKIVKECEDLLQLELSFFQFILIMSVIYFRDKQWDYVVIEAGIGGTHSQTNFLDSDYAVITSVGLDHMEFLGNTEEEICRDKWGIIREKIPVVIGPQVHVDIVHEVWDKFSAKLIRIEPKEDQTFMMINQQISNSVYDQILLNDCNVGKLSDDEIKEALNVSPPWRLQTIERKNIEMLCPELSTFPQSVYMDVGHNSQAIIHMIKTVKLIHGEDISIYIVWSFSWKKDILSWLNILADSAKEIRLTIAKHSRLIKLEKAESLISNFKQIEHSNREWLHDLEFDGDLKANILASLSKINEDQNENSVLVIWGSVFLMEFWRDVFFIHQLKDF